MAWTSTLNLRYFFPTDADLLMEWRSAFRRGLALSVLSSAFLATMTRGIIFVRMTEVRHACMDGMGYTAPISVFLKAMTKAGITLATAKATKSALMASMLLRSTVHLRVCLIMTPSLNKYSTDAPTMEAKCVISGGLGQSVVSTACRITTPSTGITRAIHVTEVKCAWKAGKDQNAVFQDVDGCLRSSDCWWAALTFGIFFIGTVNDDDD